MRNRFLLLLLLLQVIDYYAKKGNLANIPAEKAPEEVTKEVKKVLST